MQARIKFIQPPDISMAKFLEYNPNHDARGQFATCPDCGSKVGAGKGSKEEGYKTSAVIKAQHAKLKSHQTALMHATSEKQASSIFKNINNTKQFLRHLHSKGYMG